MNQIPKIQYIEPKMSIVPSEKMAKTTLKETPKEGDIFYVSLSTVYRTPSFQILGADPKLAILEKHKKPSIYYMINGIAPEKDKNQAFEIIALRFQSENVMGYLQDTIESLNDNFSLRHQIVVYATVNGYILAPIQPKSSKPDFINGIYKILCKEEESAHAQLARIKRLQNDFNMIMEFDYNKCYESTSSTTSLTTFKIKKQ
jgi:hypothetical protein